MNLVKTRVMVSKIGQVTVRPLSKLDLCGVCGRKTVVNTVLCKSCGNWIHGRCENIIRVTNVFAIDFKCRNCEGYHKNEIRMKNCIMMWKYLGDRINSGVRSRTRIGLVKFRECQDIPCGLAFPLKIKGSAYKSSVRSAMLYISQTWCLDHRMKLESCNEL